MRTLVVRGSECRSERLPPPTLPYGSRDARYIQHSSFLSCSSNYAPPITLSPWRTAVASLRSDRFVSLS